MLYNTFVLSLGFHMSKQDIVLFINSMSKPTFAALAAYEAQTGIKLHPVVIVNQNIQQSILSLNCQDHLRHKARIIAADFSSSASMRQALKPYEDRIFACLSQYENSITEYRQIIPYLTSVPVPTETSLDWATDKKPMRQAFNAYDPSLSPASIEVTDASSHTIRKVERAVTYPMIIKPSGLERSLLVSVVHNRKELAATLSHTFTELETAYIKWMKRLAPSVLVEGLMDGDMYSIDTYVSPNGICNHAPAVKVVTGRKVGFEDFFAYLQMSPAGLTASDIKKS